MKKQIVIIMALWLVAAALVHAQEDTSYLLIQGPFGSGSSTMSYKWQFNYPAGYLSTGQDLLNTIFGAPTLDNNPPTLVQNDPDFGGYPYYTAGNSTLGVSYISFGGGSYVVYSFTINGVTVDTNDYTSTTDPSPNGTSTLGWNYYVSGGTGDGAVYTPPSTYSFGPYTSGTWNFSNDATDSRFLSNDSFDGWVYGNTGVNSNYTTATSGSTPAIVDDSTGSDNPNDFSNNGANDVLTIVSVPEPAGPVLSCIALVGLLVWRRKVRA